MKTVSVSPLTRVEGHGRVDLRLQDGRLTGVEVSLTESPRLFEGLVLGRDLFEVPSLVCRICAICSAVHRVAACQAFERALSVAIPPRAAIIRELLLLGGHIESHSLHLFCLVLPDLEGGESVLDLLRAGSRTAREGLALKALGNRIQELAGGRAIHPVNVEVGGVLKNPDPAAMQVLLSDLCAWRHRIPGLLAPFFDPDRFPASGGVCGTALAVHAPGRFSLAGTDLALAGGRSVAGRRYRQIIQEQAIHRTNAKRSLLDGEPLLTGALARMILAPETDVPWPSQDNRPPGIHANNAAQAAELIWCLERAAELLERLLAKGGDELRAEVRPGPGVGTAVIEAPRGLLVHHYVLDDLGRVAAADVVTPTAINQAAMEAQILADLRNEEPARLKGLAERIVRSYDPCISCSVHVFRYS